MRREGVVAVRPVSWVVVVTSITAIVVMLVEAPAWLRVAVVVAFCLTVPGMLVAQWLDARDTLLWTATVLGTDAAFWSLVAALQASTGVWQPAGTVVGVAALALLLVAVAVVSPALRPEAARSADTDRSHPRDG